MTVDLVELAVTLAEGWVGLSLAGTPIAQETRKWSSQATFGDLVLVEYTRPNTPAADRIGIYDATWTYVGEPDDDMLNWRQPFRDRGSETVYGIKTLDGRYLKWTNVGLRRLPETVENLRTIRQLVTRHELRL